MILVENIETYGFTAAMRGMRNPMNSWNHADSGQRLNWMTNKFEFDLGTSDAELANKLYKAGTEHRKYMRFCHASMDITSNQVWWAEFDTYKVGVTRNSCSKMHKIHAKEFGKDDFSHEGIDECGGETLAVFENVVQECERLRGMFNSTKDKKYWRALIELLPEGYDLRATVDISYETAARMIDQRRGHKMEEWREFVEVLEKLPWMKEFREGCRFESAQDTGENA